MIRIIYTYIYIYIRVLVKMYPQSAEFNVKFRPGFSEFHQQVKAKMCIHVCMHRINYCSAVFFLNFLSLYI